MLKKLQQLDRRLLILLTIIPVGCLVAIMVGVAVGWVFFPTQAATGQIGSMAPQEIEEYVKTVAAEFAEDGDLDRARTRLAELDIPRPEQYVAFLADRYVQEGRAKDDPDLLNIIRLAEALGSSTQSMIAYISTPTPPPTATSPPTNTPLPTATPTPTPAPTNTPQPTATTIPPTETPVPADTATLAPTLGPPTATFTPAPPTATSTPTPPPIDFKIVQQFMLSKQENGGCMGNHNIFLNVLDVNGTPLLGARIRDVPAQWVDIVSGDPNRNGKLPEPFFNYGVKLGEVDLQKNGYSLQISEYPVGNPVSSETSLALSSDDPGIVVNGLIPMLAQAGGYCNSEAECLSMIGYGSGSNSLCWGHYSYYLVFQATHPF